MVTLVIHGTFARDETWWRLDEKRHKFASRLERALARRGLAGTVWQPALDAGFKYEAFSWNHNNYHPDRRRGAKDLARAVSQLAAATGATAEQPLEVNFVAHSHGGNVVLNALRHLGPTVRARRVVLLGTPLISAKPALRILRLILAAALIGLVGMGIVMTPVFMFASGIDSPSGLEFAGLVVLLIVLYGWILVAAVAVVDRVLQWVTWPLSWLRGHGARQVYGPPPDELQRRVASGRITIFTTHDDEADLALQLGAAPRQLYVEYVKAKLPFPASVLELILARPIVIGVLLSLLEVVLERYVLGFPWRHVLFMNYEMADLKHGRSYPKDILHRVDVSGQLLPKIRESSGHMMAAAIAVMAPPEPVAMPTQVRRASREVRTLYQKIALVVENFKKQLRLRHSVYYEVDAVIERVADVIARTAETTTPNDRVPEAAASAGP